MNTSIFNSISEDGVYTIDFPEKRKRLDFTTANFPINYITSIPADKQKRPHIDDSTYLPRTKDPIFIDEAELASKGQFTDLLQKRPDVLFVNPSIIVDEPITERVKTNTELLMEQQTYPDGVRMNKLPSDENVIREKHLKTYETMLKRAQRFKQSDARRYRSMVAEANRYLMTQDPALYKVIMDDHRVQSHTPSEEKVVEQNVPGERQQRQERRERMQERREEKQMEEKVRPEEKQMEEKVRPEEKAPIQEEPMLEEKRERPIDDATLRELVQQVLILEKQIERVKQNPQQGDTYATVKRLRDGLMLDIQRLRDTGEYNNDLLDEYIERVSAFDALPPPGIRSNVAEDIFEATADRMLLNPRGVMDEVGRFMKHAKTQGVKVETLDKLSSLLKQVVNSGEITQRQEETIEKHIKFVDEKKSYMTRQ